MGLHDILKTASPDNTVNISDLLARLHHDVVGTTKNVIDVLTSIVGYRDVGSGEHMRRTRILTEILVLAMLKSPIFSEELKALDYMTVIQVSPLHDIGKVGISDAVLLKDGKLSEDEMKVIKTHTLIGGQIIDSMQQLLDPGYLKCCRDICLYHHECFDGTGYPYGLKGYDIPLSARIVAIVDVYDALTSARPYKKAMCHHDAMIIIADGMGSKFDPNITKIFLELENTSGNKLDNLGVGEVS